MPDYAKIIEQLNTENNRLRAENEELKRRPDPRDLTAIEAGAPALEGEVVALKAELERAHDHYASCLCDVAREAFNYCCDLHNAESMTLKQWYLDDRFKVYWASQNKSASMMTPAELKASKTKGGER